MANPDRLSSNRAGSAVPVRLAIFLAPQFPMIAFASAIEPLRQANRLFAQAGRELTREALMTIEGEDLRASRVFS